MIIRDTRKNFLFFFSLIFLALGFFIFLPNSIWEAEARDCFSYFTCHYSGNPVNDKAQCLWNPTSPRVFKVCECDIINNRCVKNEFTLCWNQNDCNEALGRARLDPGACPEYGDCCGCSGRPKPFPKPPAQPRPTPTPTPKPGTKGCHQSCKTNSDCINGLVCGYNVVWGERRCHKASNPLGDCK